MLWQPSLPERYIKTTEAELARAIAARKAELGDRVVILGHHYQTDEVIQHADHTGDSLKLSQTAAQVLGEHSGSGSHAKRSIIFCGVHFMAETADILTPDNVSVILPDLSAGCSMADMADYDDAIIAWDTLHLALAATVINSGDATNSAAPAPGLKKTKATKSAKSSSASAPPAAPLKPWPGRIIPITYINSSAAIKAFVGERGGAVCTSSNAKLVLEWALSGGTQPRAKGEAIKVLFLPDQHLGRNTAASLGYDVTTATAIYDPRKASKGEPLGGMTEGQLVAAEVLLWAGHCSVHKLFRPEHIYAIRTAERELPSTDKTHVLVHPECSKDVVDLADLAGSTEYIINTIAAAPPGSKWAIGTEVHLVGRLAKTAAKRGVSVRILSDCQCLCTTMYRIDQPHILWVLDNLAEGKVVNQIKVHPKARELALLALDRMLKLAPAVVPGAKASPATLAAALPVD